MIHLQPEPQESQAEFCERCHKALEKSLPETDRRNSVCLQMCKDAGFENKLDQVVKDTFSDRDFVKVSNVPYFTEHTTKDKEGNLVVYDRNALQAIADRCNHRILDTGNFAPITEGHTPTREEKAQGKPDPDVLGYAGPYRLGLIGNVEPRWAIFTDEYQHKEDVSKLKKMRRRSPEVWLEDKMEDRFFDPIAALGAETPRLDMGMARYGRHHDGREVEKYTAVAPGPLSAFVPNEKQPYESPQKGVSMLGPEDINQIVEAMMQTEPMQWVQQQMAGGMPDAPDAGMPDAAPDMGATPDATPDAPPDAEGEDAGYEPDDEDKAQMSRYMAGECSDDEMAQYMAGKKATYSALPTEQNRAMWAKVDAAGGGGRKTDKKSGKRTEYNDDTMQGMWSKRHQERLDKMNYSKLEAEVEELKAENAKAKSEKRKVERYSRLNDMQHAGYQFDIEKEITRTTNFDDAQFDAHLDCITENYSRIPMEGVVPRLHTPDIYKGASRDEQEKKALYSKRAVEIATREANAGKPISSTEAFERAVKEVNAA